MVGSSIFSPRSDRWNPSAEEPCWHRSHQPLSHSVVSSCLAMGRGFREQDIRRGRARFRAPIPASPQGDVNRVSFVVMSVHLVYTLKTAALLGFLNPQWTPVPALPFLDVVGVHNQQLRLTKIFSGSFPLFYQPHLHSGPDPPPLPSQCFVTPFQ